MGSVKTDMDMYPATEQEKIDMADSAVRDRLVDMRDLDPNDDFDRHLIEAKQRMESGSEKEKTHNAEMIEKYKNPPQASVDVGDPNVMAMIAAANDAAMIKNTDRKIRNMQKRERRYRRGKVYQQGYISEREVMKRMFNGSSTPYVGNMRDWITSPNQ